MNQPLTWIYKSFKDLTPMELYGALALRQEVFVVEQNCPYQDADGKDFYSKHLSGYTDEKILAAYARIVPPGISFKEVSIGRVVSKPKFRKSGFGKDLMIEAIKKIREEYGAVDIRIGAQSYLLKFYESFGFEKEEQYMEDGIPHHIMLRRNSRYSDPG